MADRQSTNIQVGILTVSDSCSNGTATDRSGENLKLLVESGKHINGTVVTKDILPDEFDQIKAKLLHWSDQLKLDLILTTGGTGFSLRDVTPEATKAVLEREALGMAVAMLKGSLDITPLAMLTRLACGTRGRTLIINLPGSMKGSTECFQIAATGIPHAVDLLRDHKPGVEKTHTAIQGEGIQSVHCNNHHQLQCSCVQARLPSGESPPVVPETPTTSACLLTDQPKYMRNPDLSQPFVEINESQSATSASVRIPAKNFTSELPVSLPSTMSSSTLHFWRTLISLSEDARVNFINSVVPVTTSSLTAATSARVASPSMTGIVPNTSMSDVSGRPASLICDIESLAMPINFAGTILPSVSAVSNSYALPSLTQSSGTQPKFDHFTLPQLIPAPSLLNTSTTLSKEQWVSPTQATATSYPHITSALDSCIQKKPLFLQTMNLQSHAGPAEEGCQWSETISGLNMPTIEMADKPYTLARIPVHSDSKSIITSPRTSAVTTSSCRSAIACHDAVKETLPSTNINKGSIFPAFVEASKHLLSSVHDNSSKEDILSSSYSHVHLNTLQGSAQRNKAFVPETKLLSPESIVGNHDTVCTREIKSMLGCAGNPLVQIFLPCSQHLHTGAQAIQTKPISSLTTLKKSSLKRIVKKNRSRILNILRRQNVVSDNRKATVEQMIVSPSSTTDCTTLLSNAEVGDYMNTFGEEDVDNENIVSSDQTYLHYNICEHLEDNSQGQDVAVSQERAGTTFDEDTEISCEYEDDDFHLFKSPGQGLDLDYVLSGATIQNQHNIHDQYNIHSSIGNSEVFCKGKGGSGLPSESQHEEELAPELSGMSTSQRCQTSLSTLCKLSSSSGVAKWSTAPTCGITTIKTAKIHNVKQQGELLYVLVGESFMSFLKEHPLIQGIYLHKGKREIKKQLAQLCRHCNVGNRMTTWLRGKEILERNCFDDYFELTEEGRKEQKEVHSSKKRDQYVVNWYVWCPGHGNCRRKCGGYGACITGCQGMQHKQDRHNCSLMINMKLFLSDLSAWRVNITGTHVPSESGMSWNPPVSVCKQSSPGVTSQSSTIKIRCTKTCGPKKEGIASMANSNGPGFAASSDIWTFSETSSETIAMSRTLSTSPIGMKDVIVETSTSIPTKKRISKMLSSLKRRREERLITCKSSLVSSKNTFSPSQGVHEGQTSHEYDVNKNSFHHQPFINSATDDSMFENNNDFQPRSICQDKGALCMSCEDIPHQTTSDSAQDQELSSELLHFLTSGISQDTSLDPLTSVVYDPGYIDHKWALPSDYTGLLENCSLTTSNSALDTMAGFSSPQGRDVETSSLFMPSLCDNSQNIDCQSNIDSEKSSRLDIQPLNASSGLQEDLVSKEGTSLTCKEEVLKNSEDVLPMSTSLDFEQPFLNANSLGDILQQASYACPYGFRDQTDHSAGGIDTALSYFSSSDSLEHTSTNNIQSEQVGVLSSCELTPDMHHQPSIKGIHLDNRSSALQPSSSKSLVQNTSDLTPNSFSGLNMLLSLSESTNSSSLQSSGDTVITDSHSPYASINTSQISTSPAVPHNFLHITTSNRVTDNIDSCYENIQEQLLQEMMQIDPLPSYQEATVALAEQLGLSQSDKHM